jgi:hypothetical protein
LEEIGFATRRRSRVALLRLAESAQKERKANSALP